MSRKGSSGSEFKNLKRLVEALLGREVAVFVRAQRLLLAEPQALPGIVDPASSNQRVELARVAELLLITKFECKDPQ